MKNRTEIGKRIKELRKKHNFSQAFIAEKLFISQAAYSLIENSQNGIVVDHIIKLSKIYNVTTDFLLKGDTLLVKMSPDNGFLPLIRVDAQAGFLKSFHKEQVRPDLEWYKIPGFNGSGDQRLFEVEGKSMLPTVLPGDIVVCQSQGVNDALEGSVVVVVTKENVFIKRLFYDERNPEFLLLKSDNPQNGEESRKVSRADINELMLIQGKITNVLTPRHEEIASNSKIKALEDAIELLKAELKRVSEQLENITK
ncbi:MAG: LexA family transcriptional regulator [Salinimicrobium sp.]